MSLVAPCGLDVAQIHTPSQVEQNTNIVQSGNTRQGTESRVRHAELHANDLEIKALKRQRTAPIIPQCAFEKQVPTGLGLREQLEEKDRKLSAAREGISTVQERLIRRVRGIDAVIRRRKQLAFSRPNPSVQTFPPSSSPEPPDDSASLGRIKTLETVRGVEYDALYEQYVELQKELEQRNATLQAERAATSHIRSESDLLKAEIEDGSVARYQMQSQLEAAQTALHDAQTHADDLEGDLQLLTRRLETLETSSERLRTERDDALRTLSFLEEESNSRIDDVESRLRGCTAHSFKLGHDLAETTVKLLAANETAANMRRQNERAAVETKRLQTCATGTAIVFQHLDNQGRIMVNKLNRAYAMIDQLGEDKSRMQENLELERALSADLQRRLQDSREDLAIYPENDRPEHDDLFNFEELALASSACPRVMDYDDAGESHRHHRITDGADDINEEPSFSEAALGYSLPPPSRRSRRSDQTLASSNAPRSPRSSALFNRYNTPSPRPLPPTNTPADPHLGCREQLDGLQARIGRRNEQIGVHQAEIARLTLNLTLAEEANVEHMAEWDKLNAERNEVALEHDTMVADCAEVREARNDALRRSELFEEEIDSLRAHITTLQDQISASTSVSSYTVEQVTALVKEVILATGRAQSLESSLAEAHDALTEACELEGHLIDLQSKRDQLAAELETMGRENDRVTAQIDVKEKEIAQAQGALAAVQVEALTVCNQRDAAGDEIRSLREERQRFTVRVEELQRQLNDVRTQYELSQQQSEAKLQELDDAFRDAEEAAQAARAGGEVAEHDLHDAKVAHQQEADLLAARCSDLESQLRAVESAEQKLSERLGEMRISSARDLTSLRIERDRAISTAAEAQANLESAQTAANERVAHAEASVEKVTSDCRQMSVNLDDARLVISELERSLTATKDDLLTRDEELRRVNGMKRFLEMDMKKREAELAQLRQERAQAGAQAQQFREQTRAAEMANDMEKAHMTKELRHELEVVATSRDDAISRANAAEGRSKTLLKTQRKNEVQINMLKEKLRVTNPPLRRASSPTQGQQNTQQPLPRITSSASWRRPALLPRRTPLGASQRLPPTEPFRLGTSSLSLVSPERPHQHSKPPQHLPESAASCTSNAEHCPGSAQAQTATISNTGKRKREIEDNENKRPTEAVVVPPSSPSRIRQLAERGLRTLAPRRSPRKQMAGGSGAYASASAQLSFDVPNQHDTNMNIEPSQPRSHQHGPVRSRGQPSKPRVRLQDMLATMTNIDVK